jgi:hypothetical protein
MASQVRTWPPRAQTGVIWPPHDTEESILGTDRHQMTIGNIRLGINEAARIELAPGQPVSWHALSQIALLGCVRADGTPYRVYPDIFVYAHPVDPERGSFSIHGDGPPVLALEVLSEGTYEADLDLESGKGFSYAHAGIAEYLTIDYTRRLLPEGIRAWRLVNGNYQPWLPDANGRWQSQQIGIAISLEDDGVAVYTREGLRILREGEVEIERAVAREERIRFHEERTRFHEESASLRAEIERLRRLLSERNGQS